MGCEFLGIEWKPIGHGPQRHMTERVFCTASDAPCLIDDPLGYVQCTRRQFLLLTTDQPEQLQPRRRKAQVKANEAQHGLF